MDVFQHAKGAGEENVAACEYPRYTRTGIEVQAKGASMDTSRTYINPEINGWLEQASIATASPQTPMAQCLPLDCVTHPQVNDGQVLFFFPGALRIFMTRKVSFSQCCSGATNNGLSPVGIAASMGSP
jgi:hypothetical protein